MKLILLPGSCISLRLYRIGLATFVLFCLLNTTTEKARAQQTDPPFNRLRYRKYSWRVVHNQHYHVYFPAGYDSLGGFAIRELPATLLLMRQRMGMIPDGDLNLIIYPSADRLYESNMGSTHIHPQALPTVVLQGKRMLIAFNGSYQELSLQLREAVGRLTWQQAFKPRIASSFIDDDIPVWLDEGLIRYFSRKWPVEDEDALRRYLLKHTQASWEELAGERPGLAGACLAYYLDHHYYPGASLQLFQQLRSKRSLSRAIRLVAKSPLAVVLPDCLSWFRLRSALSEPQTEMFSSMLSIDHPAGTVSQVILSPDGRFCAYVLQQHFARSVYLHNLQSGERKKLTTFRLPPWINNHQPNIYPIMSWQPDSRRLLIARPLQGRTSIMSFDVSGRKLERHSLPGVDGISSIQALQSNQVLLSAFRKGQSDIVTYHLPTGKFRVVTNDPYDDSYVAAARNTERVVLVSDRRPAYATHSECPAQGIFEVLGILTVPVATDTHTYRSWNRPAITPHGLLATSTALGREQLILIQTNGDHTPLGTYRPFSLTHNDSLIAFAGTDRDSIFITQYALDSWLANATASTDDTPSAWLKDFRKDAAERAKDEQLLRAASSKEPPFLKELLKDPVTQQAEMSGGNQNATAYVLQLHSAYFTTRVNNDYFINRYQPYLNYRGQFRFPQPGGMAAGGFSDLFENHHFSLAYRMPVGTEGSDFYIGYANTARRTAWSALWFRKVEELKPDPDGGWKDEQDRPYPVTAKVKTSYYELSLVHPFNYYTSLRFNTAVRHDRTIFTATEKYSLHFEDINSTWSVSTLAISKIRLQPTLPFLFTGYKAAITVDLFKGFSQTKDALYAAAIDLQYHQPLYRHITAVARLKAGHSGGSSKLLYNMGGVDNNLTVRTDSSVKFGQQAPYAFQTLVTPLRGYFQNSIYGNQYILFNTDFYLPLFYSLIPIETSLPFINNLQPGLFADFAWARESWATQPASRSGYAIGFSLRSSLAGYPLRLGMAWPGTGGRPVWYLSLALK